MSNQHTKPFPTGKCHRCKRETGTTTMSRFNTDEICVECEELEKKHPSYQEAKDEELRQVQAGNMNFAGVGLPLGYEEWSKRIGGETIFYIKATEDTGEGFQDIAKTKDSEPWRNRRKRDRR